MSRPTKTSPFKQRANIFFGLQIILGLTACLISLVFMLPNSFRDTHRKYVQCKEANAIADAEALETLCPKPYSSAN